MSRLGWFLIVLVLLAGAASLQGYYRLHRVAPPPQFESAEEHFLYGSVGTEEERGIPYWIWLALPRAFPQYLPNPGGYASIGILARDGHEMPIGLSKTDIGVPRVGVNCAFCHTATVRSTPDAAPTFYPGAPAHQAGAREYMRFLAIAASDPRFTPGTILDEISRNTSLSLPDRLLYRFVLIPETRRALLQLGDDLGASRQPWGRGRADIVDRFKTLIARPSADTPDIGRPRSDSIAAADAMPLWHLKGREAHGYLWDRSATSLADAVRAKALAAGASTRWMDIDAHMWERDDESQGSSLRRILEYLNDLQPPKYPFAIDGTLAAAGAATYAAACAQCHDAGGPRANSPIPIAEIGTDRHRLEAWSAESAQAFNDLGGEHPWKFSSFRGPSQGYVAPPLDGVWVSAPYLHNGSVPTLADLLEPPDSRPRRFSRGYDVYDQARVGFVASGADAERLGTTFDVTQPGNGNAGHTYGTTLPAGEKRALVEYLKTR